ncbi:hypothetical protein A2U01_0112156, partial [Trifolium medium]|nr:hypothetical protein [Trifolium medium]
RAQASPGEEHAELNFTTEHAYN